MIIRRVRVMRSDEVGNFFFFSFPGLVKMIMYMFGVGWGFCILQV